MAKNQYEYNVEENCDGNCEGCFGCSVDLTVIKKAKNDFLKTKIRHKKTSTNYYEDEG